MIEVFQRSVNELDLSGVAFHPSPGRAEHLAINGVDVSVSCDAVAIANARSGVRVGQVFIRCAIGSEGDAAENRRADANGHLATIAHMHTALTLGDRGTPHATTSMVIDVPRRRVVRGPANSTLRVRNIEAACIMIAAVWPTI